MVALSFQPWKTEKVEAGCCQTIRPNRKRNPKPGDRLQLYNQQRVPGKSRKLYEIDPICAAVTPLSMWWSGGKLKVRLSTDKQPMGRSRLTEFAIADGFDNLDAFEDWFNQYFDSQDEWMQERWEGNLIEWVHPEPYRPSNGTSGEIFMCEWCYKCTRYTKPDAKRQCKSMLTAIVGQSPDWVYHPDTGEACCLKFKAKAERKPRRSVYQMREERGQINWITLLEEKGTLYTPISESPPTPWHGCTPEGWEKRFLENAPNPQMTIAKH